MNEIPIPQRVTSDDLSSAIRPQDDLFGHVNGRWLAATEIPSDKPRYGAFTMLRDLSEMRVRAILEEPTSSLSSSAIDKARDLYRSFLDEDAAEGRGAGPLAPFLDRLASVDSREEFLRVLASLQRDGAGGLFSLYVASDPGEPSRHRVFFSQGGLSLPDESYYREEHFAPIRDAFVSHVATMFELLGLHDAPARAQRLMDFETALATHHWDTVRSRDRDQTYNPLSWSKVCDLFDHDEPGARVTLATWREGYGAPDGVFDELIVSQPSFFEGAGALVLSSDLEVLCDWARFHLASAFAPYLSSDFSSANFDFFARTLTGTPEQRARWKRGVSLVEGVLGDAVGQVFVERHFAPSAKAKIDELVSWLLRAYHESISELEWMSDETRERALDKLALFTPKIAYPSTWRDFGALEIDPDDLIANVVRANAFELERDLKKIGEPVDRDEWLTTPQTVNAFYYATYNDITFPAAILQPPFFGDEHDAAENFGAIGAVIGHEIGHGFDDQGSKSDGTGRRLDWWTPEDREAFSERTRALISQYDALSPRQKPDLNVNGAFTLGENIGDLGGAGIAWKAYQMSLDGAEAPVIDGMTGAQRFFFAWALVWQGKSRDEDVEFLLTVDPHAPSEFRCNQIARNLDAFHEAFATSVGDHMWLDPSKRVTIW